MSTITKVIHGFSKILIKIPTTFLTKLEKKDFKIHKEAQKSQIAKAGLNKKNKAEGIIKLDLKTYYRAIIVKTAWYWYKTDTQINKTEERS